MVRRTQPKSILVTESPAMARVLQTVEELAESDAPALIVGEDGTGRELIARLLHFASPRASGTFVAVRAEVAPQALSYDPGRCTSRDTLRSAQGGTLLIKELCDLPRSSQRRLGRLLDARDRTGDDDTSGEVFDIRFVGSCNLDLSRAVDAGVFASDLYDRFGAHRIDVPALRERVADIPALTAGFIKQYTKEVGRGRMTVSTRAYERLVAYPWPGNVAELKAIARRLVLTSAGSRIEATDVDAVLPIVAERVPLEDLAFEDMVKSKLVDFLRRMDGYPLTNLHEQVVARVEKPLLDLVMEHTGHNQVRAAEILGLNRNTLRRKLGELGIHARTKGKGEVRRATVKAARTSRRKSS
jgi:two-component system, NtrC family, nitrogen regulation response regulator GlnG